MKYPAVKVKWVDPQYDWHCFYLLGLDHKGRLILKGRDDEEGNKHDGDVFPASPSEIKSMKFVRWHRSSS